MEKIYITIKLILVGALILSGTSITAQNLLKNPSFESGVLAPWVAGNNNTVNIVEDPQDGSYAANGNIEQIVSLEEGKEYTFTGYVRNHTPDLNVWAGIRDMVSEALVQNFLITSSDYEQATITFTAVATGDHRFWVWGGAGTDYTSDNFLLLEAGTTNTTELELSEQIHISNTQNGIAVKIDNNVKNGIITVLDLSGKTIINRNVVEGMTFIDNSEFSVSGIYIVKVTAGKALKSQQVMISKI